MKKCARNLITAWAATALVATAAPAQDVLWQALFDAGCKAREQGNQTEAEKQLSAALKGAQDDEHVLQTARLLAAVLDEEGKYAEAAAFDQRVVALDNKIHGEASKQSGADLNNLALVYQHASNYAEAEKYFREAVGVFQHFGDNADLANVLVNLAELLEETAQYESVEPLLKRALNIHSQSGDQLAQADCLCRIASFCQVQGRYAEAEAMYSQALKLREQKKGETDPLVSDTLSQMGRLYGEQGDYGKAETVLRRALATAELAGADKPQVAEIAMILADVFRKQHRIGEAQTLYSRALDVRERAFGKDNANVAEALRSLAQCYSDEDKYARAEELLLKALQTDEQAYGDLHPALAVDLQALGLIYLNQGKYQQAEPMYKRALQLVEKSLGEEHPDTATCLNSLAWLYYNEGKYDLAEPLVRNALDIREKQFGDKHPLVAKNLSNLAMVLSAESKFDQAEPLLLKAIAAEEESLGVDHPDISENLKNLAVMYQSEGKFNSAEDKLRELLKHDERSYGENAAPIASDLESLAKVLTSEHKNDEAAQCLTRVRAITVALPGGASALPAETIESPTGLANTSMSRPVRDKWALVVGISNFKDPSINLKYAAKDATDFRNYLIREEHFQSDHVRLLTDAAATRENIINTLGDKWLKQVAQCDDLVVVYVSSHGSAAKPEAGSTNFIVPYEGNIDNLVLTGIPMQWLTVGLKDLVHCDRIVLLLDVCHGGAAAAEAKPESKGMYRTESFDTNKLKVGAGQIIVASSQASQLSWESKNYQNGVFTRRLMEGMKVHGDTTTLDDAYRYMREKVEEEVLRDRAEVQTPVLVKHWQGDDVALGVSPTCPHAGLSGSNARAPVPGSSNPGVRLLKFRKQR